MIRLIDWPYPLDFRCPGSLVRATHIITVCEGVPLALRFGVVLCAVGNTGSNTPVGVHTGVKDIRCVALGAVGGGP